MRYESAIWAMYSSGDAGSASDDASQCGESSPVYCPACDVWLNGKGQYNDHRLRRKHRKNLNKRVGHEQGGGRDKGLVIPRGTAIIIEQGAILSDATELGHVGSASADASQLGGCSAMASGPPMYLGMHTHGVFTYSPMYCPACEMWLNGMDEYNDHVLRKKHRNNLNKRVGHEQRDRRDKGLVIPRGTAIIIEQDAILRDATMQYLHRLYSNALLRARM